MLLENDVFCAFNLVRQYLFVANVWLNINKKLPFARIIQTSITGTILSMNGTDGVETITLGNTNIRSNVGGLVFERTHGIWLWGWTNRVDWHTHLVDHWVFLPYSQRKVSYKRKFVPKHHVWLRDVGSKWSKQHRAISNTNKGYLTFYFYFLICCWKNYNCLPSFHTCLVFLYIWIIAGKI